METAGKSYFVVTYGCQMNEYDSSLVGSILEHAGYRKAAAPEVADVVLVNTCSVREKAEETACEKLRNLQALKRGRPQVRLAVLGCMAENRREKLLERLPKIDLIVGPDHYAELPQLLQEAAPQFSLGSLDHEPYEGMSANARNGAGAFIAVQHGCNFRCAYCIVPATRGPEKSRRLADVLTEARALVAGGAVELTLLGQAVNAYRAADGGWIDLLRALSEIDGLCRIRATSPHPRYFTANVVAAMAELPKVMPHVHLPVQSGSTPVLRAMRRQYGRDQYLATVDRLRTAIPGIAITTDIIAGFPGETQEDHEATLSLMREVKFDQAFMFAYSPRPGTPSSLMAESISHEEKIRRLEEIIALQLEHTRENLEAQVGKVEEVMLEHPSRHESREWLGRTPQFRKVILTPDGTPAAGQFLKVRIDARRGQVLCGTPAE